MKSTVRDLTVDKRNAICPKCGRHGEVTVYVDGSGQTVHKVKLTQVGDAVVPQPLDVCRMASEQPMIERKARALRLALLNGKGSRTISQRKRNFFKAATIETLPLYTLLGEQGYVWHEVDNVWRKTVK